MPTDVIDPRKTIAGEVRLHRVPELSYVDLVKSMILRRHPDPAVSPAVRRNWEPVTTFEPNALLYEWGAIFGNLLLRKGLQYGVGGMYIEFENVGTPGDPVAVPEFTRDRDEGVGYYAGLAGSADRDYLRVPLVAGTMDSTDATKYPLGNRPIFFAQTSGVAGVHGKPFSDADNSVVFGGALVAFVDETDHTRDLVLSRFYVSTSKQQPKLATSQVGFEWRLTLE